MARITIGRKLDQATDSVTVAQGDPGTISSAWPVADVHKLVPEQFDHITLTYVGSTDYIQTATYRTGGAGGTVVATLTIGYDGSFRITSVART